MEIRFVLLILYDKLSYIKVKSPYPTRNLNIEQKENEGYEKKGKN